jgi:hypothetical protein
MLDGMSGEMTTIKTPKPLRERLARDAAAEGVTAAGLISRLLDEHERRQRFRAVAAVYAQPDESYDAETEAWDALAGDGLDT